MTSKKIAGISFHVDKHNVTGTFPNPKDGKVDWYNTGSARMACNAAFTSKDKCKQTASLLNAEIDGDISCRFGKPSRETMESINKGIAAGSDITGSFMEGNETYGQAATTGAGVASNINSCRFHKLRDGESIEEIFSMKSYTPD